VTGFFSDNLYYSVDIASRMDRKRVFDESAKWDWENTVNQFLEHIVKK
jgi:hypothetical protein